MEHSERLARIEEANEIRSWLALYAEMHAARDATIRAAARAGIPNAEIARLVGLSRHHVGAIINTPR